MIDLERFYTMVREKTGAINFDLNSTFEEMGLDSLDKVELVMAAEDVYGIELPDEDCEDMFKVWDLYNLINKGNVDGTKQEIIHALLSANALKFGEFKLKSGRISPYFMNAGAIYNSKVFSTIISGYVKEVHNIIEYKSSTTVLFGPAYKGIPLVGAIAATMCNQSISYSFNRKEAKDHGEGGILVGNQLDKQEDVIIIEDVITAGTAIRETMDILSNTKAKVTHIIVLLDRQERGTGSASAVQEVELGTGAKVIPLITMSDLIEYVNIEVSSGRMQQSMLDAMLSYRKEYGVS